MNKEVLAEGIRRFAENAGAKIIQESDLLFQATFPDEQYPTFIGLEGFGMVMSYATPCGVLRDTELAPTMLRRNWGGVESTCFYFSVNVEEGQPWFMQ